MALTLPIKWYGKALENLMKGLIDVEDDTIKVALTTEDYTPDQDAHVNFSDVTNEVSATGYTAGGQELGTKSLSYATVTNELFFKAGDVKWTVTGSLTARNAVIYKDTGLATASPLIAYGIFNDNGSPANVTATDGDFNINWDSNGIVKLTAD
jgi:hypothetical protein